MKTITYQELTTMIQPGKQNPIIINTLPKTDYLKDHIPGSINIPFEDFEKRIPGLFAKHDYIVVYCANANCEASDKAANWLVKNGYQFVYRFVGGLEEWKKQKNYLCHEGTTTPHRKTA